MSKKTENQSCDALFSGRGLRLTEQRRQVYEVLMSKRDHPTATEVFLRAKRRMPSISLATVYNCLETLTACGMVRHVHHDRESSRYCPNLEEHGHFFCNTCGTVMDVPLTADTDSPWKLPTRAVVTQCEISLRGFCPDCAKPNQKINKSKKNN